MMGIYHYKLTERYVVNQRQLKIITRLFYHCHTISWFGSFEVTIIMDKSTNLLVPQSIINIAHTRRKKIGFQHLDNISKVTKDVHTELCLLYNC